jgi:hypothetical protein
MMKRRKFIKNAGLTAAGMIAAPYILPSGRLFANSGSRIANHVVFVLFAGGLRNQETVDKLYVSSQNGFSATGNVMPNMLTGAQPSNQMVYTPWSPLLTTPLQQQGTLFKEMRYEQGPTGHYNGHTVAMTGRYTETGLNLNVNPEHPTIFEYYRKHNSPSETALNAWWLSEGLGPYPSLNYSQHPAYGPAYGANYLRPLSIFELGMGAFSNAMNYQPDDVARVEQVRNFLNNNFERSAADLPGMFNSDTDRQLIRQFILDMIDKANNGTLPLPTPGGNPAFLTGDLINIAAAWQVMDTFKPELMVINTFNSDVCHNDYSAHIGALHAADYGVGWLWDKIQSDPVLANDTIMICMPEHGRNLDPNNIVDANGLRAIDHTGDDNSRRIFSLIVGPGGKVIQNQSIGTQGNPQGAAVDIVPTIAHILGFHNDIPAGMLEGSPLTQAFV